MRNAMKKIICICVAIVGVSVFAPVCTTYAQANDVSEVDTSKARIVGAYAQVTADGVRLRKTASTSGTIPSRSPLKISVISSLVSPGSYSSNKTS